MLMLSNCMSVAETEEDQSEVGVASFTVPTAASPWVVSGCFQICGLGPGTSFHEPGFLVITRQFGLQYASAVPLDFGCPLHLPGKAGVRLTMTFF